MKKYQFFLFSFFILCIVGCNKCSHEKVKPTVLFTQPERVNEGVTQLIEIRLNGFDTLKLLVIAEDSLYATKKVIEFYEKHNFTPVWTNKGKQLKLCDSLLELIKNSANYGLIANDYHYDHILKLIKDKRNTTSKKYDAVKISEIELLLTDAFFTMAVHISKGRLNPETLKREWKIEKVDTNLIDVLDNAIKHNFIRNAIESLEPNNKQYKALKIALSKFQFEFKDSNWDSLFKSGLDTATFNERLKDRLISSHNYSEDPQISESVKLQRAIKDLQCQFNLTEDGIIGPLTYKILQQTKHDYIRQIEMNMERWRYYDVPNENKWVWVNIPKYEMSVFEEDTLVMRSKVIVGAFKTPTPPVISTIRYFIIYPYWTVPYSIATKEILPILKRDTSYLKRENFEVLDRNKKVIYTPIKWGRYNEKYFPFYLRQRIGEENSLGVLKFNFNNKYGVYLHDTNNHKLFGKDMRALSHGCIRLEKYIDFSKYLIRDDSLKYPIDSLLFDLFKEEQKYVYLKRPIPIYINYFTVEIDENQQLFYFIDVYERDKKMLKELYEK